MADSETSPTATAAERSAGRLPSRQRRRGPRGARWAPVVLIGALLLWGLYVALVAVLVPRELRSAAAEAGLHLSLGSARSLHPGELVLRDVRVAAPSSGWSLALGRVVLDLRWLSPFSRQPRLRQARASGAELRWSSGALGSFDATLRVSGAPGVGQAGWLSLDASRTRLRAPPLDASLRLRAHLQLERWALSGEAAGIDLGEGSIALSELLLEPPGAPAAAAPAALPLEALLRVESGHWSFGAAPSLFGQLHVSGPDAGVLLDLVEADPGLRWMLAELEQQPFELEASALVCRRGLELHRVRAESGLVLTRGSLHLQRSGARGALLVRRGSFALGVSMLAGGVATHRPAHSPSWLRAELAQLPSPCAG